VPLSVEVKFWSWGIAVKLDDGFDGKLSTRDLIERQRKLDESPLVVDRLTALVVGSTLGGRLSRLSDRQIGQLLFDFCWAGLYVDSPELIIVTQAMERLLRSAGGVITDEEGQERPKPVCAKCGSETFLHYGIDEPDFWLCESARCSHKRYVGEQ
jgi:hypothetical protein